jgi:hypothetical protein
MTSVTTSSLVDWAAFAGQLVMLAAQLVIVYIEVAYTTRVVEDAVGDAISVPVGEEIAVVDVVRAEVETTPAALAVLNAAEVNKDGVAE